MHATVCREFTFDAAHKLPHHSGSCATLHGHTYRLRVYVSRKTHPIDGSPQEGMVVDFGHIKSIYETYLKPHLDHAYLNDSLPIPVTTAECIAGWALEEFRKHTPITRVRIYETPTSYAEVKN